jgi:hypothetical protein
MTPTNRAGAKSKRTVGRRDTVQRKIRARISTAQHHFLMMSTCLKSAPLRAEITTDCKGIESGFGCANFLGKIA